MSLEDDLRISASLLSEELQTRMRRLVERAAEKCRPDEDLQSAIYEALLPVIEAIRELPDKQCVMVSKAGSHTTQVELTLPLPTLLTFTLPAGGTSDGSNRDSPDR